MTLYQKPPTKIRRLRGWSRVTARRCAEALSISVDAYYRLERGETEPSLAQAVELARLFDVTIEDLLVN